MFFVEPLRICAVIHPIVNTSTLLNILIGTLVISFSMRKNHALSKNAVLDVSSGGGAQSESPTHFCVSTLWYEATVRSTRLDLPLCSSLAGQATLRAAIGLVDFFYFLVSVIFLGYVLVLLYVWGCVYNILWWMYILISQFVHYVLTSKVIDSSTSKSCRPKLSFVRNRILNSICVNLFHFMLLFMHCTVLFIQTCIAQPIRVVPFRWILKSCGLWTCAAPGDFASSPPGFEDPELWLDFPFERFSKGGVASSPVRGSGVSKRSSNVQAESVSSSVTPDAGCQATAYPPYFQITPINPLDAVWLQESPQNPCQIVGMTKLIGRVDPERIVDRLAEFVQKHRRFKSLVNKVAGRWCWVEKWEQEDGRCVNDTENNKSTNTVGGFNICDHIYVHKTLKEFTANDDFKHQNQKKDYSTYIKNVIERILSTSLPATKPKWRVYLLYLPEDNSMCSGQMANEIGSDALGGECTYIVFQVHHVIGDGTSLATAFVRHFCDTPERETGSTEALNSDGEHQIKNPYNTESIDNIKTVNRVHQKDFVAPKSARLVKPEGAFRKVLFGIQYICSELQGISRIVPDVLRILLFPRKPSAFGRVDGGPPPCLSGKKRITTTVKIPLPWLQDIRQRLNAKMPFVKHRNTACNHETVEIFLRKVKETDKFMLHRYMETPINFRVTINDLVLYALVGAFRRTMLVGKRCGHEESIGGAPGSEKGLQTDTIATISTADKERMQTVFSELRLLMPVNLRLEEPTIIRNLHAPVSLRFRVAADYPLSPLDIDQMPQPKSEGTNPSSIGYDSGNAVGSPVQRLWAVKSQVDALKNRQAWNIAKYVMSIGTTLLPDCICQAILDFLVDLHSCAYTNVIGPDTGLSILGAPVSDFAFWPPGRGSIGWTFAALTFQQHIGISIMADENVLPICKTQRATGGSGRINTSSVKESKQEFWGEVEGGNEGEPDFMKTVVQCMIEELKEMDEWSEINCKI